jgi:acylphosphatase
MVRYHIVFKGMVQGVGFRFTAQRLARKFGVTGWVRNNPDGAVEVIAQAPQERLDLFLTDLREYFKDYIHDCDLKESSADEEDSDFKIVF